MDMVISLIVIVIHHVYPNIMLYTLNLHNYFANYTTKKLEKIKNYIWPKKRGKKYIWP
jgi:hypothetical protein